MKLIVFMEPEEREKFERTGKHVCKPEGRPEKLNRFIRKTNALSYPTENFVSIAVLRQEELPCGSGAHIYALQERASVDALDYATIEHSELFLKSIVAVANDDLKQVVWRIAELWSTHGQWQSEFSRSVQDLRKVPNNRRQLEMIKWTWNRGEHGYSEARLNRPLLLSEVKEWGQCDIVKGRCQEQIEQETDTPTQPEPGEDIASYFR
ncbi:MAG: hypothetical protein WCC26_15185 [Terracidiphilus sp.]